jgi:hypothetical protein
MTRTIEIIVAADGKTTVQTRGFVGSSCQDASRFIEQALGSSTREQRTAEFYQTEPVEQSQEQQT